MDKKKWYVHHNGKAAGPFSSAKLKQLAAHGRIDINTQVRLGEGPSWVTASKVKGLFPKGAGSSTAASDHESHAEKEDACLKTTTSPRTLAARKGGE